MYAILFKTSIDMESIICKMAITLFLISKAQYALSTSCRVTFLANMSMMRVIVTYEDFEDEEMCLCKMSRSSVNVGLAIQPCNDICRRTVASRMVSCNCAKANGNQPLECTCHILSDNKQLLDASRCEVQHSGSRSVTFAELSDIPICDRPDSMTSACIAETGVRVFPLCNSNQLHCVEEPDVNNCNSSPCNTGATCYNSNTNDHGYDCVCPSGYTGINCEIDVNNCNSSPCNTGATCYNSNTNDHGYDCVCPSGYTGIDCGIAVCNQGCSNGGSCIAPNECSCLEENDDDRCENADGTSANLTNPTQSSCGWMLAIIIVCIVVIICMVIIMVIGVYYYRRRNGGGNRPSSEHPTNVAFSKETHSGGDVKFANSTYADPNAGIVLPVQINKSDEYQDLKHRSKQGPYQELKKKADPNSYDDSYIDPDAVRELRKPTAPPENDSEYTYVDSKMQNAPPSMSDSKNGTATGDDNPEYDLLGKIRNGDQEKGGDGDTYQHLKSDDSPSKGNEDEYQHLQRDMV